MSKVSIALVGESFFLCGPGGNNIHGAATSEFARQFEHKHSPGIHHTYVALGEGNSYYIRYINEKDHQKRTTWSLSSRYPGLDKHLDKDAEGDPICVSLGENGHYFIKDGWGTAWNLPESIKEHTGINDGDDPVDKLWLGKNDSYIAQKKSGRCMWNLKGLYGSLDQKLRYRTADIRCVGLNLEDDRSYFVLFKDMTVQFNAGRAQLSGRGLSGELMDIWVQRFKFLSGRR